MWFFYYIAVKAYGFAILIFSLFNKKAAQWISGRVGIFKHIENALQPNEKRIWFHCPSLGEFEQGKPVLDAIRNEYPNHKIVLTFFSPSGYLIKKNEPKADYVFYLPLDGPSNSKWFVKTVQPSLAFFVKYDFWHFYIKELRDKKIPVFSVAAIFRPSQIYFKWYGKFFKDILRNFTHLFVQNQESLALLYRNNLAHVSVSGDTRFDRVYENSRNKKPFQEIEKFKNNQFLLVAGSTWNADEKLIADLINKSTDVKFVVAPHEINLHHIETFRKSLQKKSLMYSDINSEGASQYDVLIIDNVGMLSRLYAYADISYVGGGFGAGIHNSLEAIAFGAPVLFGTRYEKFQEAIELVQQKTAFEIVNSDQLIYIFNELKNNAERRNEISTKNIRYIESRKGATDVVMNYLRINFSH